MDRDRRSSAFDGAWLRRMSRQDSGYYSPNEFDQRVFGGMTDYRGRNRGRSQTYDDIFDYERPHDSRLNRRKSRSEDRRSSIYVTPDVFTR